MSVIQIKNIYKSFADLDVLTGVSFNLEMSKVLGLIGPSGGGKSILLKIIGQVLEADSGTVDYAGIMPEETGLMFQEGALFDSLSVFDNVAFPLVNGCVPTSAMPVSEQKRVAEKVMYILSRVGLEKHYDKFPAQLSGGMKRRVSLARTLVSVPRLALLDDPTCGLDPIASNVIMNLIIEMQKEMQSTMIIASQDLRRLFPYVDSIVALFDGSIAFQGTVDKLRKYDNQYVRNFVNCRYEL